VVGVQGFEPWTPCSQSRCATRLRYTPTEPIFYTDRAIRRKSCNIWAMVAYFSSKIPKQYRALFLSALLFLCLLGTQLIGLHHSISHASQQQGSVQKAVTDHQSASFSHNSDACHLFDALTLAGFIPSSESNHFNPEILVVAVVHTNYSLIAQARISSYLSRAPPTFII
jgi:hypothetical protein